MHNYFWFSNLKIFPILCSYLLILTCCWNLLFFNLLCSNSKWLTFQLSVSKQYSNKVLPFSLKVINNFRKINLKTKPCFPSSKRVWLLGGHFSLKSLLTIDSKILSNNWQASLIFITALNLAYDFDWFDSGFGSNYLQGCQNSNWACEVNWSLSELNISWTL